MSRGPGCKGWFSGSTQRTGTDTADAKEGRGASLAGGGFSSSGRGQCAQETPGVPRLRKRSVAMGWQRAGRCGQAVRAEEPS